MMNTMDAPVGARVQKVQRVHRGKVLRIDGPLGRGVRWRLCRKFYSTGFYRFVAPSRTGGKQTADSSPYSAGTMLFVTQ